MRTRGSLRLSENKHSDAELALLYEAAQVVREQPGILGPEVEVLGQEMANWLGTKYAIGCNSGFGAHLLSLMALGLKRGARVAVPVFAPYPFVGILLRKGFVPVLIDIREDDFQMDVSELARHIDGTIDAISVHHLFGGTVGMQAVMEVAGNIPVIEVLTHSLGAHIGARYAGTFGTVATADLLMTMGGWGDAGMIWANDSTLVERICKIRAEDGMEEPSTGYTGLDSGNFHQDTLHAAFLLRQFKGWQEKVQRQAGHITLFAEAGRDKRIREIRVPEFSNTYGTGLMVLAEQRNELMAYLQSQGIEAAVWHWCPVPIHWQPGFEVLGYERGAFPAAERVAERLLQLPVPKNEEDVDYLIGAIVEFYQRSPAHAVVV